MSGISAKDKAELQRMSEAELNSRKNQHKLCLVLNGLVIGCVVFFEMYLSQYYDSTSQLLKLLSILAGVPFGFLFYFGLKYLNGIDEVLNERAPKQSKPAGQTTAESIAGRHETALALLKRCEENGITSLSTEEDESNLWIIAESMGIASKEQAVKLYQEAKNPSEETVVVIERLRAEKRAAERAEKSREDLKKDKDRLKQSSPDTMGRNRYTAWAEVLRDRLQKEIESLDASSKVMTAYPSAYPAPQKSVGHEAMKGQLIGGAGLAAAKAMEAQNFNARSATTSADLASGMAKLSRSYSEKANRERGYLEKTLKYLDAVGKKLIDDEHTGKYAEMVEVEVVKPTVTDGGNLRFELKVSTTGAPEILGKRAFLDGTFDIVARLGSHVLGSTSWCPWDYPSRQEATEDGLSQVAICGLKEKRYAGFNRFRDLGFLCYIYIFPDAEITTDDLPNIEFDVKPRKIWAVEGGSDGLLYSFK